jgi:hypothetical protein
MIRKALLLLVVFGLLETSTPVRAQEALVLIAHRDLALDSLGSLDIRKLYLGFVIRDEQNQPIRAILNGSDGHLWNTFLQSVMGMSDKSYERRVLTLTLQSGRVRPHIVMDLEQLLQAVETEPNAVAFAWQRDIEGHDNLKVLRVLWQE